MRPETKRRLINGVISLVVLGGLLRFFSGELSRKDEVHEREMSQLTELLYNERTTSESLRTELKNIHEKKKITRTKDKDGNEKEVIVSETDTTSEVAEYQSRVTELEYQLKEAQAEKEYIRRTSTPLGQAAAGTNSDGTTHYFRAGWNVFGPVGVEGQTIIHNNEPMILFGASWTF